MLERGGVRLGFFGCLGGCERSGMELISEQKEIGGHENRRLGGGGIY